MKQTNILFLLFILFTSCNQPNFYRESLLKELQETKADAGLLILLKDKEIAVKVNRNILSKVITEGTGKNIYMEDVPIAGKTGNAENEVSCCAYFTLDNSVYTCLVIISNPKKGYPSGGMMAGNVINGIVNQLKGMIV